MSVESNAAKIDGGDVNGEGEAVANGCAAELSAAGDGAGPVANDDERPVAAGSVVASPDTAPVGLATRHKVRGRRQFIGGGSPWQLL